MNHVVPAKVEHGTNLLSFEISPTTLLSEQWRQWPVSATQTMYRHVWMVGKLQFGLILVQQIIRVDAMHNIDVMAGVTKRVGQAIDVYCISAETVRWIKRCVMQ